MKSKMLVGVGGGGGGGAATRNTSVPPFGSAWTAASTVPGANAAARFSVATFVLPCMTVIMLPDTVALVEPEKATPANSTALTGVAPGEDTARPLIVPLKPCR